MDSVLLPFQFPFMQNAIWAAAILAVPTAILSCFLVLKGWALMGDAMAHATLPGIVLAYIAAIPLAFGAAGAAFLAAMAIGYVQSNSRIKQDTVMGIVFSGLFGLGLVIYTQITSDLHLDHILFGNILGISGADLMQLAAISGVVLLALLARWRDLLFHAFDPAGARALGLPAGLLHYGFLALLSAMVVAILQAVGLILAIGLLIAPGAIGFLLARRFAAMMGVAVAATLAAMIGGVYASFWIDSAPAPTIVLALSAMFVAAFVRRSLLARRGQMV